MKTFILSVCCLVSLTVFAGEAFSQRFAGAEGPPSKEQKQEIRKRIETLKMWQLTKTLDLTEERAAKLFPVINEYDKKRFAVRRDIRKEMRTLKKSVDAASEKNLIKMIDGLENRHRRLQGIDNEEMKRLRDILTARDLAKFIIFKQDFDREMKKIIEKVRKRRIRKHREGGGSQGYYRSAPSDITDSPSYK